MIKAEIAIVNCKNCWDCINGGEHSGLHARPSAIFVEHANDFKCDIQLSCGGYTKDGRSIMGIMMLEAKPRDAVKIKCNGPDEKDAITELSDVLIYRTGDMLCSQFKDFRADYTIKKGFGADEYRKIESLELLKAFAIFVKGGNACSRHKRRMKK